VVIEHKGGGRAAGAAAAPDGRSRRGSAGAGEEAELSGKVGAVVHTRKDNIEVAVPLPIVHGILKLSRFLPESLRDKAFDVLASRGIVLQRGGANAEDRIIEQISRLNVDIATETIRVRVFTE
jgi:hypothetical protein